MKLYDVAQRYTLELGAMVRLLEEAVVPPGAKPVLKGDVIRFDHLDGMYTFCMDADGYPVHPAAATEVELA